jgi:hypothetical protein
MKSSDLFKTYLEYMTNQIKSQQKVLEKNQEVPQDYFCPISQDIMSDPVVTPNGTTCERASIETWLLTQSTCPFSREPLTKDQLRPNRLIKNLIEQWKQQNNFQTSTTNQTLTKATQSSENKHRDEDKLSMALNEFASIFKDLNDRSTKDNLIYPEDASQFLAAYQKLESSIEGEYSHKLWEEVIRHLSESRKLLELSYLYVNTRGSQEWL